MGRRYGDVLGNAFILAMQYPAIRLETPKKTHLLEGRNFAFVASG